jgi:hypothetical protein
MWILHCHFMAMEKKFSVKICSKIHAQKWKEITEAIISSFSIDCCIVYSLSCFILTQTISALSPFYFLGQGLKLNL